MSHRPAAHRSEWKVCLLAFWFEDKGVALSRVDGVDKARISHDSIHRRRRVPIHGRWSLGRVPCQCSLGGCLILLLLLPEIRGDRASFDLGLVAKILRRWLATAKSGGFDRHRF